jgi:hypothetical protein
MHKTNIWDRFRLHRNKTLIPLLLSVMLPGVSLAQRNYLEYINKKYYFGITMGTNISDFKITHSNAFAGNDSIKTIGTKFGPGFNLGIIANYQMGDYFDLRLVPALVFADKKLEFGINDGSVVEKDIQSIITEFPLELRFKSQPIRDIRVYVLTGLKYSIDLAANAKDRKSEDQIRVSGSDLSYEMGMGIQFFFPLFIFSPEIKFANGFYNLHAPNETLIYSNMIDKLYSRTISLSFHFEG